MNINALTYELAVRQVDETVAQAERRRTLLQAAERTLHVDMQATGAFRRKVGGAMIAAGRRVHGQGPAAVGQPTLGAAR